MNRVGIFWDYENCAPPTGTPGYVVAERLRAACGVHGSITQFRAYLELSTSHTPQPNLNTSNSSPPGSNLGGSTDPSPDVFSYPSTSPKTLALRSELQSSGVSLIDCPHNSRKNVADTMLACDLVCFALDHPTTPHVPQAGFIPSSPYSIPSTPFSYIPAPLVTPPKTTVILVSGDRDFAYPLAVLKARRYEVGLIVPPGGAHPALRAQASWVLNWKDVLEDAGAKGDLGAGAGVRRGTDVAGADGHSSGLGVLMGVSGQPIESRPIMRRSSFASRRGSVSASRRGSMSTPTNSVPPVPPPPPELPPTKALLSSTHASPGSSVHGGPTTPARRPPLPPPPPEEPSPSPQTSVGPRSARRPSVRRAAKAGSRPPSRSRSRAGMRGGRQERTEQEATSPGLVEQQRPRPTIVPVALTPSPVGSVGPSFAGMSPRTQGRSQTPPLFSTHPTSPPPTLAPPPTPPVKPSTPPSKPPTPHRDATRPIHKPSIPHVATPRPPLPTSQEPPTIGKPGFEVSTHEAPAPTPVQAALSPTSNATMLQTLVPAAPALRPTLRPALTVPSLSVQQASAPGLTPATPVTPPASPPFRWARLQPVYDGTDVEADKIAATEKKVRKGKEKSKGESSVASNQAADEPEQTKPEGTTAQLPAALNTRREPERLAVEVGLHMNSSEESSAIISGVDSILRSYAERTPGVDGEGQRGHFDQDREGTPMPGAEGHDEDNQAPNHEEEEDEDEEKFDESYFASLSRAPAVTPAWTPSTALALETPPTVKAMPLDFASGESAATAHASDFQRPLFSTPRPAARTFKSLPIMQSLLAGVEGTYDESQHSVNRAGGIEEEMGHIERLRSRSKSPPALPRRTTSLPTSTSPVVMTKADSTSRHSTGATTQEFRVLISVLERYKSEGNLRPLRSLIGAELSRARETFGRVGAGSFREYVHRAITAGVVDVGGGQIQGQEWISLSQHWQQFD